MKTIGLIGGMSWQSTLDYYKQINQQVNSRLGGLHSAKISMVSLDFAELEANMVQGNWDECAGILSTAAKAVEQAGADCLLICTNTLHKVAPEVAETVGIPLLHIADGAGEKLTQHSVSTVGLLGTRFTMAEDFYRKRLANSYGLEVLVPTKEDRTIVDRIIFKELCQGEVHEASKKEYIRIIKELTSKGAEATLLGCTEIAMLVSDKDVNIPLFDTTAIHTEMAVDFALDKAE